MRGECMSLHVRGMEGRANLVLISGGPTDIC